LKIARARLGRLPVSGELGISKARELGASAPSAGGDVFRRTTAIACGSVNMPSTTASTLGGAHAHDRHVVQTSIFGGKGVGLINLLVYLIVGVFLAGADRWAHARVHLARGREPGK